MCPSPPDPIVKVWDSYAILEDPGITFRHCATSESPTFCPHVILDQEENLGTGSPSTVHFNVTVKAESLFLRSLSIQIFLSEDISIAVAVSS